MRIRHRVNPFITDDAELECVLYGSDDTTKVLQQIDTMQRFAAGRFSIAISASEALPTGDVDDVRGVYIRVDTEAGIDIDWNAIGTALEYRPADANTDRKTTLFQEMLVASATLTNPSATVVMTGIYVLWGDPLP